eukprot:4703502-Prymnesium_polylepis.1
MRFWSAQLKIPAAPEAASEKKVLYTSTTKGSEEYLAVSANRPEHTFDGSHWPPTPKMHGMLGGGTIDEARVSKITKTPLKIVLDVKGARTKASEVCSASRVASCALQRRVVK